MTNSATPVPVSGGLTFATVSAGGNHTCGVTSAGIAYCWGENGSGQLGNATTTNSATPVPISGGLGFATVSAGGNHTCGVTSAGSAYCWGSNSAGQLGNGTTINSATLVPVSGELRFVKGFTSDALDPSISSGGSHTCGIDIKTTGDRTIYCWGNNDAGQLGNGTLVNSSVPVAIEIIDHWSDLTAGSNHTCAVLIRGSPLTVLFDYCWGDNSSGQLGDGTTTNRAAPVLLPTGFAPLSAGTLYSCAALLTGPFCWGNNGAGQLGNGTMTNSATPVPVSGGLDFATISAGGRHACGVTRSDPISSPAAAGAVYCWGDNTFGQLGNSWTTTSSVPVNVAGPP